MKTQLRLPAHTRATFVRGILGILPLSLLAVMTTATCGMPSQGANALNRGALVAQGGGDIDSSTWEEFIRLAGGPDAQFVFIPTADEPVDPARPAQDEFPFDRVKNVVVVHTRCREEANDDKFVAPIRRASGVWFGGGLAGRLVDAYLDTRLQREVQGVLDRGGVVGGSSAGALILASQLMRGRIRGIYRRQEKLVASGYETGFGYLRGTAIDVHIDTKGRVGDLAAVVAQHPSVLGIGLEERAAIVVERDTLTVLGPTRVAITDGADHAGSRFYYVHQGERLPLRVK